MVAKPLGQGVTFVAQAKLGMPTARGNDDGYSRGILRRDVGGDRRRMHVHHIAAFLLLRLCGAGFRTGSSFFPEE